MQIVENLAARARRWRLDDWPVPEVSPGDEPTFLFILTPSYGGSTALAKVLNTSPASMLLTPNGEGMRLVPGLMKARWNAELSIDWTSVRTTWLRRYQDVNALVGGVRVVIEKSPPNMIRADQLASCFERTVFVASNRDPYANCSSILHRWHPVEKMTPTESQEMLASLAMDWISRSQWLRQCMETRSIPLLTYERFCDDPATCAQEVVRVCPELEQVDVTSEIQVKDYAAQPLRNQNERQIGYLAPDQLSAVSQVLRTRAELVAFFGYEIR